MQVPLLYTDAVIGISGSNISYIRRASGATIAIQETRGMPEEMTVEINGSASQVQTAQQLIQVFYNSCDFHVCNICLYSLVTSSFDLLFFVLVPLFCNLIFSLYFLCLYCTFEIKPVIGFGNGIKAVVYLFLYFRSVFNLFPCNLDFSYVGYEFM